MVYISKGIKAAQRSRTSGRGMNGPWSKEAIKQYRGVSKENREEFRQEKKVQELAAGGFNEAAISGMTRMSESSVKSMMKRTGKNIHLDGKV